MSISTTNIENNFESDDGQMGAVQFYSHFTRNQFEKLINMRIDKQLCHDVKCHKEKEYLRKAISRMEQVFGDIFVLYEKQRRDLFTIYTLYSKLCDEFVIPNKLEKPNNFDSCKFSSIAAKIREHFSRNKVFRQEKPESNKESKNSDSISTSVPINDSCEKAFSTSYECHKQVQLPLIINSKRKRKNDVHVQSHTTKKLALNLGYIYSKELQNSYVDFNIDTPTVEPRLNMVDYSLSSSQKKQAQLAPAPVTASVIVRQGREISFYSNGNNANNGNQLQKQSNNYEVIQID